MNNFGNKTYQKYLLDIVSLYRRRQDLRDYLELLLSIAAIAVFTVFAIRPTAITITSLITKINSEEETLNKLTQKITNLNEAQTLYVNEQNNIKILGDSVPGNPNAADYMLGVQSLMQKDNLAITSTSISPTDLTAATGPGSLTLTLTSTGGYEAIVNFLKDVENLRRPNITTRTDITKGDNSGLTFTATLTSPFLIQ